MSAASQNSAPKDLHRNVRGDASLSALPLWTSVEAARACRIAAGAEWQARGICSDSRKVAPGDLFIALSGPNHDGHDFVAAAFARGAVAALVSRRPGDAPAKAPLLEVDDVLFGLSRLAKAARTRSSARILAVTGSVGKTSTKETLKLVLSAQAPVFASPASYNNHWGVPLSLAALPREAKFGIFEIGMNHAGEIKPLSRLVAPHVGIVTAVESVHAAFFKSMEQIADAKAEIFVGMDPLGRAVLNRDNPFHDRLVTAARACGVTEIVDFGAGPGSTLRLIEVQLGPDSSRAAVLIAGERIDFEVGAPGRHWVTIAVTVLAAVHAAGGDVARAAESLKDARAMAGRGARRSVAHDGGAFTLIDESYNANPVSMRAAIETLGTAAPGTGGRRIAVLGDMLELGDRAPDLHAGLAAVLIDSAIDLVFTVGANMAHLRDKLPKALRAGHAERSGDLVAAVAAAVSTGDVVMVKGSLGTNMAPIVAGLSAHDCAASSRDTENG